MLGRECVTTIILVLENVLGLIIIVGQTKPNMRAITSDVGLCIVRVAKNIQAISAQNLSKVQHVDHK